MLWTAACAVVMGRAAGAAAFCGIGSARVSSFSTSKFGNAGREAARYLSEASLAVERVNGGTPVRLVGRGRLLRGRLRR